MKDKNKDTQQRTKNKGGMNKSILCQQGGYFVLCGPKHVLKNRVYVVHPNFCPELAFFPYALGHLLASAAHNSRIIHTTTKPTAF